MTLGIPLALPTLAAHTPPEHSVKIVDEEIEDIDFDELVDIVGITAMTFKAKRAYEVAREFRERGVKVIMGGIHASMCPDEVSEHVDCVVIGEAENLWPKILANAAEGKLKNRYVAEEFPDLKQSRSPRYELVKNRQYLYSYLQTTRGCPFDCSFCTVTKMSGRKVRKKTPEQVIDEVDSLLRLNPKRQFNIIDRATGKKKKFVGTMAFIDDNFAIDRNHALAICNALQRYQEERNIVFVWYTQVNSTVGFDEELLTAMENANCQHFFIGFESLDSAALQSMKKRMNKPEKYEEAIRNIHRHGIRVVFSTIIGDDYTSRESTEHLREFIQRNNVFHVLLNILTPYPGTQLFEEMNKENRILTLEAQLYNIRNVVFRPKRMTPSQLQELYMSLCSRIFQYDEVYKRGKEMLSLANRLYFPLFDRVAAWMGLCCTCLYFTWQGRLRLSIAMRILLAAPFLFLLKGSLFAVELLIASADYDDFAYSESKRFNRANNTKKKHTKNRDGIIEEAMQVFPLKRTQGKRIRHYKAFHISSAILAEQGIKVSECDAKRPIVLLGGTSIPISDRREFITFLLEAGYEVATIENPIGGPFDIGINPKRERPESLRDFMEYLRGSEHVEGIDIVAQSYSAFEVIRVLWENPVKYRHFVRSIILINPPGLNNNTGFLKHSFRFLWLHVLKGYARAIRALFGLGDYPFSKGDPREKEFIKREVYGISSWSFKTFRNLVRTLKETYDIVTFRIKSPLRALQNEYGYDINMFLQTEDQLLPVRNTLEQIRDLLPDRNVKLVPGGHNDLFFQQWQREAFLHFIKEIREREQEKEPLCCISSRNQ
jgi:radical SAM superfamily enzyme YgiQ (UPF0313 family)